MRTLLAVVTLSLFAANARAQGDDEDLSGDAREESAVERSRGERSRTLAERVPSVTSRMFRKEGRLELIPAVGMSLNDPFYDHLLLSLGVAFHVLETLSVNASGDFHVVQATAIQVAGGGRPQRPDYNRQSYAARAELAWAPFYGKLNLFAEKVLHFDTYFAIGGGVVGPTTTEAAVAGSLAIGQHYFLSEWMALRLELRDQLFSWSRNPDVNPEKTLQNFLSFTVGLSFYVPAHFERETL